MDSKQEKIENIFAKKIPEEQMAGLKKWLGDDEIKVIELLRAIPFGTIKIHKKKNEVSGFIEFSGTY
ncbi:MAG: hypothetical protein ACTSW1_08475 [Candidatus Hodarchaeales archaeon]